MKTRLASLLTPIAILGLAVTGCASDSDPITDTFNDADQIASALELENGGLTMDDELAQFGDAELFADAELADGETAVEDTMEANADVQAMLADVDAILFNTTTHVGPDSWQPGERHSL